MNDYEEWRRTFRRWERARVLEGPDGSLNCPTCLEESYTQLWPSGQSLPRGQRECSNKHRSREVRALSAVIYVRRTLRSHVAGDGAETAPADLDEDIAPRVPNQTTRHASVQATQLAQCEDFSCNSPRLSEAPKAARSDSMR